MISEDRQEQTVAPAHSLDDSKKIAPAPSVEFKISQLTTIESFEARQKYEIQLTKDKFLSLHEFLLSMDLDQGVHQLAQTKRHEIGDFIFYFNVEVKTNTAETHSLKWQLKKRYVDFIRLEHDLTKELVKTHRFPIDKIPLISSFNHLNKQSQPDLFLESAEKYLTILLNTPEIRQRSNVFYDFIELSLLPLASGTQKYKEGYLRKRGGGRFKRNKMKLYLSVLFKPWQKRWFVLTEEGIIYTLDSSSTKPREMLLFDQTFQMEYGRKVTGHRVGISLKTPNRRLVLQAYDVFEALVWMGEIKRAANASPYTKMNRYLSYAPIRGPTNYCKWFVDADGYFEELYDALLQAKSEVFITDWWLSPEISLKKPVAGDETRLDQVLGKIARTGVKVYVIVYHEVKMVMYNDSEHTKRTLEAQSSNIKVLQHPSEPFFSWSHHEKLVVIDQQIGFVGGLDLCFGRSDTRDHPLFDPAEVKGEGATFPGQDYTNPRLADFRNIRQWETPLIDKQTTPRMPFHDAMIKLIGPVVADLCRHFMQYWNHVEVDVYNKGDDAPLPQNNLETLKTREQEIKSEQARARFKGAFQKIFAAKNLAGGNLNKPPTTEGKGKETMEQKVNKLLKSKTSLPSLQTRVETMPHLGTGARPGTQDDFKVTVHKPENRVVEEPDEPSFDNELINEREPTTINLNHLNHDQDQNFMKEDVLIQGKNETAEEPRAFSKIVDTMMNRAKEPVSQENPQMNPIVKRALLNLNAKRVAKTQHHLENPKAPPTADEQQDFNKKYADLLAGVKKREIQFDEELQNSRSKQMKRKVDDSSQIGKTKFFDWKHRKKDNYELKKYNDQKGIPKTNMMKLLFQSKDASKLQKGTMQCQMLRSASKWSLGLNNAEGSIENSIQNAYIEIIQNAKHFIYIENQFFMSGTAGKVVKNGVAQALVYRIEKAHYRKEKFRVLVFLPLLPAFEGEVIDSKAALLRIQMHWQYMTICRGGESIYEQLRNKGIRPEDYIQFYSLRTHAVMPSGKPVTELIYIHSKILIADDDIMLIGSANINDRSLQGSRDSELAIVIEDSKKINSYMDDVEVQVGEFACSFRRRLMSEHLGLSEEEVEDPISDDFTARMNQLAEQNTNIYRDVFACYPDDNVKVLEEMEAFQRGANPSKYNELAPKIVGHIVWFPLNFLANEHLQAPKSSMEYYIPDQTFV